MSGLCSVVCVTYNHAEFAAQGLQSIFDQTYRELEIIVLDDGSTDNTADVVRGTLKNSPFPAQLIEQENTGNVPGNFNTAISHAKGEFLSFLSLDDLLLPDCIEPRIGRMSADQNMIFAADTGYQDVDAKGDVVASDLHKPGKQYDLETVDGLLQAEFEEIGSFYIQGQVFRSDAVAAIGGFDDKLIGDDIILRTKLFQYLQANPELRFHVGDRIVFGYRIHGSNLHKQSFRQIKTVIEWKEKFFSDREYPELFYVWLRNYFQQCLNGEPGTDLKAVLDYNPIVSGYFEVYRKTWKYRRRMLKARLQRVLG